MNSELGFDGRVVLVTGAASGIGKVAAMEFANAGARVVLSDLEQRRSDGEFAVEQIIASGAQAIFVACDVTNEAEVDELIEMAVDTYGCLNAAYNNAGISEPTGETHQCSADTWDRIIGINLRGVWLCLRAEIRQMLKQGGGAIVNCSSVCGLIGWAGAPAYTASKHAVVGLTKTAALENARRNIRVNAVCPGVVDTPMVERIGEAGEGAIEHLLEAQPVGRLANPEEIASAVLWLCSPRASFVTGQALAVDGGWVAR